MSLGRILSLILTAFLMPACTSNFLMESADSVTVGSTQPTGLSDQLPTPSGAGNGHGYDGLRYVAFADPSICAGGIRAAIYLHSSGEALLVRDNCADIPPKTLSANSFSVESVGSVQTLTYNGANFQPAPADPSPTADSLAFACSGANMVNPSAATPDLVNVNIYKNRKTSIYSANLAFDPAAGLSSTLTAPTDAPPFWTFYSNGPGPSFSISIRVEAPSAGGTLHMDLLNGRSADFLLSRCIAF